MMCSFRGLILREKLLPGGGEQSSEQWAGSGGLGAFPVCAGIRHKGHRKVDLKGKFILIQRI